MGYIEDYLVGYCYSGIYGLILTAFMDIIPHSYETHPHSMVKVIWFHPLNQGLWGVFNMGKGSFDKII
jgi:hypothetical protein